MSKLLVILAVMLATPVTCLAVPATDKVAHFGVGYIINDQLFRYTKLTFIERTITISGIAYAKERHDAQLDRNDILATIAGGMVYEVRL